MGDFYINGMVFDEVYNPVFIRTEFRLSKYGGYETHVKIPAEIENCPVTQIGPHAFYRRPMMQEVLFPDSIISIDESAFSHCPELVTVKSYPSNYRAKELNLFGFAFSSCPQLTSFHSDVPISVYYQAFENCTNLTKMDAVVNGFGCRAFSNTNVKEIRFTDNALWGKGSFLDTKITDLYFEGGISEKVCKSYFKDIKKRNLHINPQKFNCLELMYEGYRLMA